MKTASVLIVDDSRIFRAAVEAALSGQEGINVVGSVFRGEDALDFIHAHPPDVVTLDVEMPGMNGLQILHAIQQFNCSCSSGGEVGVIMVSAFTKRGAEITVQALQAGAFDFVTKPASDSAEKSIAILRQDLLPKVKMYLARRARRTALTPTETTEVHSPVDPPRARQLVPQATVRTVRAILIGASTGGPKALAILLPALTACVDVPILVVQHMPPDFTSSLAEHLARRFGFTAVEAQDGGLVTPRTVYIARGGKHLVLRRDPQGRLVTGLNDQLPESGSRPSASVLFRSAAAELGRESVGIQLTGMGNDGTAGLGAMRRAGAYIIAQDEESSVVWGMPGSAVTAGVVDVVLPLNDIAAAVGSIVLRRSAT